MVLSGLVALTLLGSFIFRQQLIDYYRAETFQPTSAVTSLASSATLTPKAEHLFYASQPQIESADTFNQHCAGAEPTVAILGCYNGLSIYVYNVSDTRLEGIKTVTAAHEMLHAAYARLSKSERNRVNTLLTAAVAPLQNDPAFKERLAYYERNEPYELDNELHSILATEIETLPPELENYYKEYFYDRSRVVRFHQAYEGIFNKLKNQADELSEDIDRYEAAINPSIEEYNTKSQQLNDTVSQFNDRAASGNFSSEAQFRLERQQLTAQSDELDARRRSIEQSIVDYRAAVSAYNDISVETQQLSDSINSKLNPTPGV